MPKLKVPRGSRFDQNWQNKTMEEIMEEIERQQGEEEEPILLQFRKFVDSCSTRKVPCGHAFLVGLIRDVFYLIFLIGHEIATDVTIKHEDDELPQDANVIANFFGEILDECRRLNAAPEHFPSPSSRKAFLTKIASLCSTVRSIDKIIKQHRSSMWHISNLDLRHLELIGIEYPENDRSKLRSLLPKALPAFHPDRRDAKNPWNNWLDNSAQPAPGWIAVQQKIPRIGDAMNRKKVQEYDILEANAEMDQLLPRNQENGSPQIPEVGHEFKHMTWSGFCTVPRYSVGFSKGTRKGFDTNGIVTLEYLSKGIQGLNLGIFDEVVSQRQGPIAMPPAVARVRRYLHSNVPYFRYAMAYKP